MDILDQPDLEPNPITAVKIPLTFADLFDYYGLFICTSCEVLCVLPDTSCGSCNTGWCEDREGFDYMELLALRKRRHELLLELSETDKQLGQLSRNMIETPKASERAYLCTCGQQFQYFIDRMVHFETFESDDHRDAGELIDGKLCLRDTSVCGDPIISRKAANAVYTADELSD